MLGQWKDFYMWREMGHDGAVNAGEGLRYLYCRILKEATLDRMTGKWDGVSEYRGKNSGLWNIPRVEEIIKENKWQD